MAAHKIDHIGLLKMDIEGGGFAVFAPGEDLLWLERVRQIALEVILIEGLREKDSALTCATMTVGLQRALSHTRLCALLSLTSADVERSVERERSALIAGR